MDTFRIAHVATCSVFLAALVLQFALAAAGMPIDWTIPYLLVPIVLVATAWSGRMGSQQLLRAAGLLLPLAGAALLGLHPAFAILVAGYVLFEIIGPALDLEPRTARAGTMAGSSEYRS